MDLHEMLFSPLDRRYCNWFYGWMVFNFITLVVVIIGLVSTVSKKGDAYMKMIFSQGLLASLFGYINARMWYSMCLR